MIIAPFAAGFISNSKDGVVEKEEGQERLVIEVSSLIPPPKLTVVAGTRVFSRAPLACLVTTRKSRLEKPTASNVIEK
jgi:hypothetical protein